MNPSRVAALGRLLEPNHVAVIGASARRSSAGGNQVIRNLLAAGFAGRISVVSRSGEPIEGIDTVVSVLDLDRPDVAVVSVPGGAVLDVLRDLETRGCIAAIVPSSAMAPADLAAVADFAETSSMLVHGPNCMGIINANRRLPLWIDEGILIDVPVGRIALIAQSGSAAIFVARTAAPHGFSKIISTGNELSTTTADYISYLAGDPDTDVIGLVLESIPDAAAFSAAIGQAREAGKPVVALKVGRTEVGGLATTAHTGAMLSADSTYTALFAGLDVPQVADYDELASSLTCLATLGPHRSAAGRVAVATISGGQAALTADLADAVGTHLPRLSESTILALKDVVPDVSPHNPLDAGGTVIAKDGYFVDSLRLLVEDESIDALLVVLDAQQSMSDVEVSYEESYYRATAEVASTTHKPVVLASSSSVSLHPRPVELAGAQVPVIRGIRNALVALRTAAGNSKPLDGPPVRPVTLPADETVHELRAALRQTHGPIDVELSRRVLSAYGIPFVASATTPDADGAVAWAGRHGYPVVLKIDSPDVPHRSDVGGVVTGIPDEAELRAAADTMLREVRTHLPEARLTGFEIQEFVQESTEAFTGYVMDLRLGATVGVGMGGTLVELLNDAVEGLAPLDPGEAAAMIARSKLGTLLDGYRNLLPPTSDAALVDVVVRTSWLAADLGDVIREVDLNPVLIEHGTGRVRVVDSLLVSGGETVAAR